MRRFFEGRNGNDALCRALLVAALALLVASLATTSVWSGRLANGLWVVSLALLAWSYFRMFSKNIYARQAENEKYLALSKKLFGDRNSRARRREERKHFRRFFCPKCRLKMRVPRGKGKVKITCSKCGAVFYKKT
jgi:ribosomal protein S27E